MRKMALILLFVSMASAADVRRKIGKGTVEGTVTSMAYDPSVTGSNSAYVSVFISGNDGKPYVCSLSSYKVEELSSGDAITVSGDLMEVRNKADNQLKYIQLWNTFSGWQGCKLETSKKTDKSVGHVLRGVLVRKVDIPDLMATKFIITDISSTDYVCIVPTQSLYQDFHNGDKMVLRGYISLPKDGQGVVAACAILEHEGAN